MLIGESKGRPNPSERVGLMIDPQVRANLTNLLFEPEMRAVGFSEFIARAVEQAHKEIKSERAQAKRDLPPSELVPEDERG